MKTVKSPCINLISFYTDFQLESQATEILESKLELKAEVETLKTQKTTEDAKEIKTTETAKEFEKVNIL